MTDHPTTCPTCGPRDWTGMHVQKPPPDPRFCDDPWHDRPTDDDPPTMAEILRDALARIRELEAERAILTALGNALAAAARHCRPMPVVWDRLDAAIDAWESRDD